MQLAQLAVLAAAAVDAGMNAGLVALRLAFHASSHTGNGLAARFGNGFLAFVAMGGAFACGDAGARIAPASHGETGAVIQAIRQA